MKPLNVFIIDDDPDAAQYLACQLMCIEDIHIKGLETKPMEAIPKVLKTKPDVLFLDVEMPVLTGFELINELKLKQFFPIFILTTCHQQYGVKAIRECIFDYLIKPIRTVELINTVDRVKQKIIGRRTKILALTSLEKKILKHLLQGKTSTQIGDELFLSYHTINSHRSTLLKKLNMKSTAQLISSYSFSEQKILINEYVSSD